MEFTQNSRESWLELCLTSDKGSEIVVEFEFDDLSAKFINLDEQEYDATDDRLICISIEVKGKWLKMSDIVTAAEAEYEPINREMRIDSQNEDRAIREISSPYQAGRI